MANKENDKGHREMDKEMDLLQREVVQGNHYYYLVRAEEERKGK